MLRPDAQAQRAIEVAEALARRSGPETGWAPVDELLYRWRLDLSSGTSALARALSDDTVWDSSMIRQLERAFGEPNDGLRPQPRFSIRPAGLVKEAEKLAAAAGAVEISESNLVEVLVRQYPQALTLAMVRADRLVAAVAVERHTTKAVAAAATPAGRAKARDVFISHAHEDKDAVAGPLAVLLRERGLSVWYDEYELQVGDSLREKIDEGLANCRSGVVVLSHSFFAKRWPRAELDGLAAREAGDQARIILPVWHELSSADVLGYSPTLAGRVGVPTSIGMPAVAARIASAIASPPPTIGPQRLLRSFASPEVKRERIQPAYATLLRMIVTADRITQEMGSVKTVADVEATHGKWDQELEPLRRAADNALIELRLETGTDEIIRMFFGAVNEFTLWRIDHSNEIRFPRSVPPEEFARHRAEFRKALDTFEALAKNHLASLDPTEQDPVRIEAAPGMFSVGRRIVRALMISVYCASARPQRVDGVGLTLSGGTGQLQLTNHSPFPAPPQLVSEVSSYTTAFRVDLLREALAEQQARSGKPISVTGVQVRLASGRQVFGPCDVTALLEGAAERPSR